jgi:hypothetical protein
LTAAQFGLTEYLPATASIDAPGRATKPKAPPAIANCESIVSRILVNPGVDWQAQSAAFLPSTSACWTFPTLVSSDGQVGATCPWPLAGTGGQDLALPVIAPTRCPSLIVNCNLGRPPRPPTDPSRHGPLADSEMWSTPSRWLSRLTEPEFHRIQNRSTSTTINDVCRRDIFSSLCTGRGIVQTSSPGCDAP